MMGAVYDHIYFSNNYLSKKSNEDIRAQKKLYIEQNKEIKALDNLSKISTFQ